MTASQNQNGAAIPNGPGAAAILAGALAAASWGSWRFPRTLQARLGRR